MTTLISQSAIWKQLQAHQQTLARTRLRELFAQDQHRFEQFSITASGILLDYSKNHLTPQTLTLLLQLAEEVKLKEWIERMFSGEKINHTEQRAVLHIALRNRSNRPFTVDGHEVMPAVNAVLGKMRQFSEAIRNHDWRGYTGKPIDTIVNIGIGGSDLGPRMVARALRAYQSPHLRSYFVSNVDATHLGETLTEVNPETTLFIVASKTFTTQETMLNARSARQWLVQKLGNEEAVAKHFVAVSTAKQLIIEFGINPSQMFEFWDWVGGRYSLWSAIGLSTAITLGMDNFEELLAGAHELDQHFYTAPLAQNLPVLMGLIGVWYTNFFNTTTQMVLPYDFALEHLPSYLQQLVMESLGKRVTREGKLVDYLTCPVIGGAPGNNGQHAFYQLLHQGTQLIPADFIVAIESQYDLPGHQAATLSNALAQSHTLMQGRTAEETKAMLLAELSVSSATSIQQVEALVSHRTFPGNQPSNTLIYQKLTPKILGALLALYEHKVFVQSVCWDINAFDQWGVELGKQVANVLLPALVGENTTQLEAFDASTRGLVEYIKKSV